MVSAHEREIAFGAVVALHAFLLFLIMTSLHVPPEPRGQSEMTLSLQPGGPRASHIVLPPTQMALPEQADPEPPQIAIADASPPDPLTPSAPAGGDPVTIPAEAIGEFHSAPALTNALLALARRATLRLLLTIGADGTVVNAAVDNSSGSATVDSLAIAWVTAHWRYKPATRGGEPIPVTTVAVVPF